MCMEPESRLMCLGVFSWSNHPLKVNAYIQLHYFYVMFKSKLLVALLLLCDLQGNAQRKMDNLGRGLVAVNMSNGSNQGNFVSWRILGHEYYDVTYNLYRDGTKVNASPLNVSNCTDTGGSANSTYTVKAVVRGVEQSASAAVKHIPAPWHLYQASDGRL